ncbi:MAG: VPLPA-CTERM sorting domain-containing protein [Pseudomonadota bacterium]
MKGFRIAALAAAALFAVSSIAAHATTLPAVTDTYEGIYKAEAYSSLGGGHALWLPGLISADTDWKFRNGTGRFTYDTYGGNATLTGEIVNDNGTGYFDVDMEFSFLQKGGDPRSAPKCELGSHCNSTIYQDSYSDNFEYFDIIDTVARRATLTGYDALDGVVIEMSQRPADLRYPLQIGYSADNKRANEFGGSVWFNWSVTENANNFSFANLSGHGDVNIALTPMPLPASSLLLIAGLGGLVALRRRKTA